MTDWKPIPGTGGNYEASSDGEVRNTRTGRVLKANHALPYDRVKLGRGKTIYVHRAVLLAFRGAPDDGQEARHLNGDRQDNRIENLEWGTRVENAEDRLRHGTAPRLERHGEAKIGSATAERIRAAHADGASFREIGRRFGISKSQAHRICTGDNWSD